MAGSRTLHSAATAAFCCHRSVAEVAVRYGVLVKHLNVRIKHRRRRLELPVCFVRARFKRHATLSIRTVRPTATRRRDSWRAEVDAGSRRRAGGNESCPGRRADCCCSNDADAADDWCTPRRVSGRPTFDRWYVVRTPARPPAGSDPGAPRRRRCRLLYGSVNRFHCPPPPSPGLKFTPDRPDWSTLTAEMEMGFTSASLEMPSQVNDRNFPAHPQQETPVHDTKPSLSVRLCWYVIIHIIIIIFFKFIIIIFCLRE